MVITDTFWGYLFQLGVGLPSLANIIYASIKLALFIRSQGIQANIPQVILALECLENFCMSHHLASY